MSDMTASFDVEVRVDSLRALMLWVVEQIGLLNRRRVVDHFTVTLSRQTDRQEMHEESIPYSEGHALPATEPRITSTYPIDQELEL